MSRKITGRATPEGTARYASRATTAAPGHFRLFEARSLSSIGIGTYLGNADDATDHAYQTAIVRALERSVNVIDTAINYRHQRSERTVGRALAEAIATGKVRRDEVIVATKAGFVPMDASPPRNLRAYLETTYVQQGLFSWNELVAGCHCMAPRFLLDQIERSRNNLGLETIDIYYLHNPETQLAEVPRETFIARIRAAFEVFEQACADGKIGVYGTATWNGFREAVHSPLLLSLEQLWNLAREVAGDAHHFRVIQLPVNMAMREAFSLPNQHLNGKLVPVLTAASELGMYVMASGPLLQGRLAHGLPAWTLHAMPRLTTDAQRALQFTRSAPGVGTALVGMKSIAHVEENTHVCQVPPLDADTVREMLP